MTEFNERQPVTIKSAVRSRVIISDRSTNLRREWAQKGAIQRIPYDQLEMAYYRPGTQFLFEEGILFIENPIVRQRLGLETKASAQFMDDKKIQQLLTKLAIPRFKTEIEELTTAQARDVARAAIELKITDTNKMDILKEKTGQDIQKAIKQKAEENK